jgi:hypothetical protein
VLALDRGRVSRVLGDADTETELGSRHIADRSVSTSPCKNNKTHFIHSSYATSEPVALVVTFPPTGLPFPVAPWGSSSPPSSPALMFSLVKSPKPWICQYRGVLTKWAAVTVPSGIIRALLRGSRQSALKRHMGQELRVGLTHAPSDFKLLGVTDDRVRLGRAKDTPIVDRVQG